MRIYDFPKYPKTQIPKTPKTFFAHEKGYKRCFLRYFQTFRPFLSLLFLRKSFNLLKISGAFDAFRMFFINFAC